ncbi:Nephrocystin-3, partial [Paramuricea clavata]
QACAQKSERALYIIITHQHFNNSTTVTLDSIISGLKTSFSILLRSLQYNLFKKECQVPSCEEVSDVPPLRNRLATCTQKFRGCVFLYTLRAFETKQLVIEDRNSEYTLWSQGQKLNRNFVCQLPPKKSQDKEKFRSARKIPPNGRYARFRSNSPMCNYIEHAKIQHRNCFRLDNEMKCPWHTLNTLEDSSFITKFINNTRKMSTTIPWENEEEHKSGTIVTRPPLVDGMIRTHYFKMACLNPTIKIEVNNLRELRNEDCPSMKSTKLHFKKTVTNRFNDNDGNLFTKQVSVDDIADRLDRQPLAMAAAAVTFSVKKAISAFIVLLMKQSNYSAKTKAQYYHDLALKIRLEKLGQNHVKIADSYNNLGYTLKKAYHNLVTTKDYYEQALEIRKRLLRPNHVHVALSYMNLGRECHHKGELKKAKDYYQQAINIQETKFGSNHVEVAWSYDNLGLVYHDENELEKAKDCLQRALDIRKEQLGPNHVDVAWSLDKLGLVYHDAGDLEEAKNCYERALKIRNEQLGTSPSHVNIATCYNNLGAVYYTEGDLDKAKANYERALEIANKQLRPLHVNFATYYNNLGTLYSNTDELEKAKNCFQRALDIRKDQLDPNHVDVADSYNRLCLVYLDMEEEEKAQDYYDRGQGIETGELVRNHATLYGNRDDLRKAKDYRERGLEVETGQYTLPEMYFNICELEKAKDSYERGQKIETAELVRSYIKVSDSCYNHGRLYGSSC